MLLVGSIMRERLLLLSRFPLSPPNPRVNGGLPLLLGGFLHRHGGLLLPRGGFSCSQLSPQPNTTYQSFLCKLPTLDTHLHQTFKPLPPPSGLTPSADLRSHLSLTAHPFHRHSRGSEPMSKTLYAATKIRSTTQSTPIFGSTTSILLFLLRRSLAGALCHLWISLLPAPSRPPPEPPPSKQGPKTVSVPFPNFSGVGLLFSPSQLLLPIRPPPKPPWLLCVFPVFLSWFAVLWKFLPYMVVLLFFGDDTQLWIPPSAAAPSRPPPKPTWSDSVSVCGALGWLFFFAFGQIKYSGWSYQFWVYVVSVEASVLEILSLATNCNKFSAGTLVVINVFSFLSFRHAVFNLVVWLDHRETTHSRTVHISAKEMIRNWIDSKTVDSPPIMAIYHSRMLFVWLIGIAICFDVGPMWPTFYLCIVIKDLYVLIIRSNSITRLGYALKPYDLPECNVFSQLMK